MQHIFFSFYGDILPLAYKMQQEGENVIVAQIRDIGELRNGDEPENKEERKRRLSRFDGMIKKYDARKVLMALAKKKNKNDVYIWFEFNSLWRYSQALLKMGYTQGLFPTKKDFDMEKNREDGKEFVRKNYTSLKVAELHEFDNVKEGIEFLQDTDKFWVIKSRGDIGETFFANTQDLDIARKETIAKLEKDSKDYEKGGYILEQRILNPIEFTPQMVWWNGEPVYSLIDIENKPIAAGNVGFMVGCASQFIIRTEIDDKINKMFFPPAVHELVKQHKGLFVFDAGILYDGKDFYFSEFCSQRWGYDCIFSETAMAGDRDGKKIVSAYFNKIIKGSNPLRYKFGTAVRMFNLKTDIMGMPKEGLSIHWNKDAEPDIYLYDVKKTENYVTSGYQKDLAVITGFGNDLKKAIQLNWDYINMFSSQGAVYRTKEDMMSAAYATSLMNRYNKINELFYETDTDKIYPEKVAAQSR